MSEINNGSQPQGAPVPPMQPPMPPVPPQVPQSKGFAIASMVLGIVSLVFFCVWYISVPSAIVGLILGILALRGNKPGRGMAIAGVVMSAIGVALTVLFIILAVAGLAAFGSAVNDIDWSDYMSYMR